VGFGLKAYLMAGLLFVMSTHFVAAKTAAKTIDEDRPALTILVYNTAGVPVANLIRAEQQAELIFREAGIRTAWVDCSAGSIAEACHKPAGPNQFVVHIVPRGRTSTDAVFGLAFLGTDGTGQYTDVFYDRIEQMHRDSGVSPAQLLGAVAAHEIGHLLLGSHSHSALGIMAAHWRTEELRRVSMGCLGFDPDQASRMRSRIAREDEGQRSEVAQRANARSGEGTWPRLLLAFGRLD
jgi:hypothetical protein